MHPIETGKCMAILKKTFWKETKNGYDENDESFQVLTINDITFKLSATKLT